jgi:hypothetical protein
VGDKWRRIACWPSSQRLPASLPRVRPLHGSGALEGAKEDEAPTGAGLSGEAACKAIGDIVGLKTLPRVRKDGITHHHKQQKQLGYFLADYACPCFAGRLPHDLGRRWDLPGLQS